VSSVKCVPVKEKALHMALLKNRSDMVKALLASGADPEAVRQYGSDKQTAVSLAGEDASLLEALRTSSGWSPENHLYFSDNLKKQVSTVLLVAKAQGWKLPEDALHTVFAQLAISSSSRKPSADAKAGAE